SNMIRALDTMVLSMDQYIDQLNKTNELIHDEKEFAEVTLSSIADGVIVTDTRGIVNFLNPAAEKIIKYTISEAKNKQIEELFSLIHEDTQEEIRPPIYESIAKNKEVWLNNKAILLDKEATRYAIEDSSAPIRDIEGRIRGAVFVFRDITQKKKDERKVRWQATHDELTKLNNRIGFHLMLDELCLEINEQTQHILFFMDLDKFKIINDTAGHLAGDEVLRQIAKLLQKKTRKNDFLCRFGGDEFGLILKNCDIASATKIANKLIEDILDYSFVWGERQFKIGLSIGIAIIDRDNNNPTTILSNADFACYKAKDLGRNRYYVYKEEDNKNTEHIHEINWVARINRAMKNRNFVLYVQKIQGLTCDETHYEVLIRLLENGEIFYPDSFLPHAQIYSLMPQIDRYVIGELFSWYDANRAKIAKNQKFSINLAGQSISDSEFARDIIELSVKYAIDPSAVIFEVTESTAIENLHLSIPFFTLLKEKGFAFSLDDFGTGLSSFAYLKSLPVDYLKIDGVFIKDILNNEIDKGMVESIHKISSLMQIKTVAEYVENDQITDTLKEIGIDYAQGYAIAKPRPIKEIV
ncbi:MAG: EAL domain-containing protein, partial [Sulfurimonadaceae bacterium]